MTGVLHTAWINAIEVIVSSDKLIKTVNFKLGNEMWRWINQHDTSVGQRKILSPRQNSPWVLVAQWIERPPMVSQMLQNSTTCTFIFNNLYLCSTTYIYIQHLTFIFNNTHFLSTSTKILFIQQKYLFNFNHSLSFGDVSSNFAMHVLDSYWSANTLLMPRGTVSLEGSWQWL